MEQTEVDVIDLDCIYLSYDEPQKEEFWTKIKNIVPWARRVDGVKGSDAAHKAAADESDTDRFIVIDGDNLPDPEFFDLTLQLNEKNKDCQFRWKARNIVNGLVYGNGGLSCWTKDFVYNMKTHENTTGSDETNIEFCFDPKYLAMYNCYSTTFINYTAKQAWRAGFREGVKMCTRSGIVPTKKNFREWVWPRNMRNLLIWQNIGRDVDNGLYAILGARLGTHYLMLRDWDHTEVRDFDCLDKLWALHKNDDEQVCREIGKDLKGLLGMNICEIDSDSSKFFREMVLQTHKNRDPMLTELSVVREEEGW